MRCAYQRQPRIRVSPRHPSVDMSRLDTFQIPDTTEDSQYDNFRRLKDLYGKEKWLTVSSQISIFEAAWYLRGLDQFMMDMALEPGYAEALMDKVMQFPLGASWQYIELGADMVWFGDDVSMQTGMIISPDMWRRFLKPRYAILVSTAQQANPNIKIAYRSCGNCGAILDDMVEKVSIANKQIKLEFDLSKGTYYAIDLRDGVLCIRDAHWTLDTWSSWDSEVTHQWHTEAVNDELGRGKALIITSSKANLPDGILEVVLYKDCSFVAMAAGLDNKTDTTIHLKTIQPLADGDLFPSLDKNKNFRLLDGYGGGEPLEWGAEEYTAVHHGTRVQSRNNLLVTFGESQSRRSLVLGGLTYADYEKFAHVRQLRRTELEIGPDGKQSLLCYLNLGVQKIDAPGDKPALKLIKGESREHPYYGRFWCPEFTTTVQGKDGVTLEAIRLDKRRSYWLGFSWSNMDRRTSRKPDRIQSISVDGGPGTSRTTLLDRQILPMWSNPRKQEPHQAEIKVPGQACVSGRMRIFIESQSDDPSAVISEIWLRDGTAEPLLPAQPTAIDQTSRPRRQFSAQLYAEDPVGKRIDPGVRYMPEDRFYLDFITRNPFEALEQYGRGVRKAQNIDLNMYYFPTVCLWYAHHRGFGGGKARNDTLGAIAEIEQIAKTGFPKYSRAAVRLVPDSYTKNSHQGWWDDAHFQRHGSTNLGNFEGGQYKVPYETSEKSPNEVAWKTHTPRLRQHIATFSDWHMRVSAPIVGFTNATWNAVQISPSDWSHRREPRTTPTVSIPAW